MNYDQYDLTPGLPKINSQQYGSQDQPLYNTTPSGNLPTLDTDNDHRTSYDYKSDYQQALRDTADPDDNEGYHISSNGNKYEMVDNSRNYQLRAGITSYMATFFATGGDNQKAFVSSFNAIDGLESKAKRFARIDEYEAKGYNPMDIQNYINDGDPKTLIASKGKWKVENGYMVNDLTGEYKELGLNASEKAKNQIAQDKLNLDQSKFNADQKQIDHVIDEGNMNHIIYKDGTETWNPKGMTPDQAAKATTKQQGLNEARQEQVSATSTNAKQAEAYGNEIASMPGLEYAGPGWANRVSVWAKSGVGNENPLAPIKARISQYNNNLTTLGNASLYTEASGKRIFAKEMENAGKKFIMVDPHTMNDTQIKAAVKNNNQIISMYYDWEKRVMKGQGPVAPSTQTQYPQGETNPTPRSNLGSPIGMASGVPDGTVSKDGRSVVYGGKVYTR